MLMKFSLVLGRPGRFGILGNRDEAARAAAASELERKPCYWRQTERNIASNIAGA